MAVYKIMYGLDESITVDTLEQMNIFTAGLMFKGESYSVSKESEV